MPEGVSVIICCHNSSKRITPTLEALQQQNFSGKSIPWEVLLVDNASSDNTTQIANEIWNRKPVAQLSILREEKPGLMEARKKGLAGAAHEIVSFIDDDNWVESGWIQKVAEVFSIDENIGACGGRSEAVFEETKPGWFDEYQNSFAVGKQDEASGIVDDKKGFLWGAGLSFRKKLWEELQQRGFRNLTTGREGKKITAGEDTELCYAIRLLGYHLYYRDDLSLKHFMPGNRMNTGYLLKMFEGFGIAYARLNCYRKILYEQSFTLHPWWYEWMSARKKMINYHFREKTLAARVKRAYNKGYANQMWSDRDLVHKNADQLRQIFKKQSS